MKSNATIARVLCSHIDVQVRVYNIGCFWSKYRIKIVKLKDCKLLIISQKIKIEKEKGACHIKPF